MKVTPKSNLSPEEQAELAIVDNALDMFRHNHAALLAVRGFIARVKSQVSKEYPQEAVMPLPVLVQLLERIEDAAFLRGLEEKPLVN